MRQQEADRKVYVCYYCAIVSARVLSNGGVLVGNKLMSGSTGSTRCYVRPPLKITNIKQTAKGSKKLYARTLRVGNNIIHYHEFRIHIVNII